MENYHVVGVSHIDLGFTVTEEELDELLEIYVERMLYIMDRDPEISFSIEQMSHYKKLLRDRPDLHERVKDYIQKGRIEIMGAMASSMETNFPNGECFVRNQKLGLEWAKENFDAKPESAWLIDTFGMNAQIPQIYRQFGFNQVFANRFGGDKMHEIFKSKGLDGTELLVIGRDSYSQNVISKQLAFGFSRAWRDTENLFRQADGLKGPGPRLITYYIENEHVLSTLYVTRTRERQGREGENWILSTHHDFVKDLLASQKDFPVLDGDLNPEFTGTFALRTPVKLHNRKAETVLLEAEKWSSLLLPELKPSYFDEAWWNMAFNHFHDVFTGSHSDKTFNSVLDKFKEVGEISEQAMQKSVSALTKEDDSAITFINGLAWERTEWMQIPHKYDGRQIVKDGKEVPTVYRDGERYCLVTMPATGAVTYNIGGAAEVTAAVEESVAQIGNEFLQLKVDKTSGAYSLYLADGTAVVENALDYLTIQEDVGGFQIENPNNSEVFVTARSFEVSPVKKDKMGETITVSGKMPYIGWNRGQSHFDWSLEFRVNYGENNVKMHLDIDWLGEGTRIRVNVPTTVNASSAIYEIPFGVVERTYYRPRGTAKGEWPAHRFVAFEDGEKGIALINTGVAGVEINGRTLSTTLLRAYYPGPMAWVSPTPLTSQHGKHSYDFMLAPYKGSWKDSGVVRYAQEFNNPARCFEDCALIGEATSFVSVDHDNLVISTVKAATDNSGDLIIRYYETFGEATNATIAVKGAVSAVLSDVNEVCGESLPCSNGEIAVSPKPFEIQTIRIKRA